MDNDTDFIPFIAGMKKRTCFAIESFCGRIALSADKTMKSYVSDHDFVCGPGYGYEFKAYVPFRNSFASMTNGSYRKFKYRHAE